MIERIAIMGAGSLGTVLGAFIAKNGRQIDLIDANGAHVDALNKAGARVTGYADFSAPVHALRPGEMQGSYDLFIYMVKQTYNEQAIPQMLAHSHSATVICTCQNGLPENKLAAYFPAERIFGAPICWGATWEGPGCSRLTTRPADITGAAIGTLDGSAPPALYQVKEILSALAPLTITRNLPGLRWCKLIQNVTFSGLSTVLGGNFGEVLDSPEAMEVLGYVGRECVSVCRAAAVRMEKLHFSAEQEIDLMELFSFETERERLEKTAQISALWERSRALEASMLQDLKKGLKKTEVMDIPGAVAAIARQYAVPTPVTDRMISVIQEKEQGILGLDDRSGLEKIRACCRL